MRILLISIVVFSVLFNSDSQELDFHDEFLENFQDSEPEFFRYGSTGRKANFKWNSGKKAKKTDDSKILSFKIDPGEVAGPGKGPEIISIKFTHFGSYATRLKVPDPRGVQPNVGAVVGYFTYHNDPEKGLSEIDFEWLLADPEVIYLGTWTGESGKLKRVGRTINLAKGIIYTTEYREDHTKTSEKLTDYNENFPKKIEAIEGFDASAQFHTYGFDWHPDRIRWWMLHPTTADTVVLWDYKGEQGIPQHPSKYRMNFWHTDNWSVETNPKSLEKPKERFELEVDWMGYRPY
jgi:beta-glucanase (GH16 family)